MFLVFILTYNHLLSSFRSSFSLITYRLLTHGYICNHYVYVLYHDPVTQSFHHSRLLSDKILSNVTIVSITGTSWLTVRRRRLHHDRLYSENRWRGCHGGHGVRMVMMMMVQSRRVILLMMVMVVRMMVTAGFLVVIVAGSVVVALMMMMVVTVVMIIVHRSAQWRRWRWRRLRIDQVAAGGEDVVNRVRTRPL